MCTVIVLRDVVAGWPLVVGANRDELYERPTDGPARIGGAWVPGVDRVSGGTWMGATPAGLFVAVTNRYTGRPPDPTKRSRGAIVTAALAAPDREAAVARAAAVDPADYNGFNLLVADARGAEVVHVQAGEPVEVIALPPGVTVLANDRLGAAPAERVARAAARAAAIDPAPPRAITALADLLADHAAPVCLHSSRYGTRSSALVAVGPEGLARFLASPGPACRAPMFDILAA